MVDVVITDSVCFEVLKLRSLVEFAKASCLRPCQVSGLAVSQFGTGFGH